MDAQLKTWALPRLRNLLPLDDDSLSEILTYTLTLDKSEAAEHLKNLLGESGAAVEFIGEVNRSRADVASANDNRTTSSLHLMQTQSQSQQSDNVPKHNRHAKNSKTKAPLHNAGPVRRPEGYGDVSGGYLKGKNGSSGSGLGSGFSQRLEAVQMPLITDPDTNTGASSPMASAISIETSPAPPQQNNNSASKSIANRNASPAKLPPSAAGNLISDFMPNVRSKQSKPRHHTSATPSSQPTSGTSTPRHHHPNNPATKPASASITDITSALTTLELSTNPTLTGPNASKQQPRQCSCAGTLHPLFTPAPNCLSCGHIICAYEGLQPCSFCTNPILTPGEIQSMIRELRRERGEEKMELHNKAISSTRGIRGGSGSPLHFSGAVTPSNISNSNSNNPSANASANASDADTDTDAAAAAAATLARAHRDKLLTFQSQNTQRTKIHDEAADYDVSSTAGGTTKGMQWLTPLQRAAALKKQQAYMRELEEQSRPEYEREKTVVSLSMRNGKLVKTFKKTRVQRDVGRGLDDRDGDEGADGVDGDVGGEGTEGASGTSAASAAVGKGTFSDNPLLKGGGLIRPIWKSQDSSTGISNPFSARDNSDQTADSKGKGKESSVSARERKSLWRRVQDDNEDNEQWILDGGLRGYVVESRTMEDGSQQECG